MDIYNINGSLVPLVEEILFDENKKLKIVSYDVLKHIPQEAISAFCCKYGFYNISTTELIELLQKEIGSKKEKCLEIGAGNGVMAKHLGILATDSFMQNKPEIQKLYKDMMQETVPYGENVIECSGNDAIKIYKPQIVIAAWVTHKYKMTEHWREGSELGVEEEKIIKKVKKYIHIGNENSHSKKPILKYDHRTIKLDFLVSRSLYKEKNVIYIWENR